MTKSADPSKGGDIGPKERAEFRRRLSRLDSQLEKARGGGVVKSSRSDPEAGYRGRAIGTAMRMALDLVAGVGVGGFIGWWLDDLAGTKPIMMIVFFGLGLTAGFLNVLRTARRLQNEPPVGAASDGAKPGTSDAEDER